MPSHARILIVDDTRENARLLEVTLQVAGYKHIECLHDGRDILDHIRNFGPDIILLDLMMSPKSGYEVLNEIRQTLPPGLFLPILIITADDSLNAREKALSLGATDFIQRPHQAFDVILRVRNLLESRFFYLELLSRNENLEKQARGSAQQSEEEVDELKLALEEVIDRFAAAGEHLDADSRAHNKRVASLSRLIAQNLRISADEVELLYMAAHLHDVGKIGISDALLFKPTTLTLDEFSILKTHCQLGAELLGGGETRLLKMAESIAISHHERFDGSGYPYGLAGEDIPLVVRIVAVADVFDSLVTELPNKPALSIEDACAQIEDGSGRQFDPRVVTALISLQREENVA
ncbi:MAG: response regulator [Proteobacteria bacterium]|nr:MAG: response regulator [Pseudomonadota bacterium]